VSKRTCSHVTGGLSGAHPPDHPSDRPACVDGNTTHTSVHRPADMAHLKDICISISSMAQCKKTISVAMVSHFSVSLGRVRNPRYSGMRTHPVAFAGPQTHSPPPKCKPRTVIGSQLQSQTQLCTWKGLSANTRVMRFHGQELSCTAFQT
jgi:hypothetical protein